MPSGASACAWSLFLEEEDWAGLICLLWLQVAVWVRDAGAGVLQGDRAAAWPG